MKILNPFGELNLSEKHRKWTLPLLVFGFSIVAILTQYTIITTWMLNGVPTSMQNMLENPNQVLYAKIVLGSVAITSLIRLVFVNYDFIRYQKREGNKISANYMYWIMSGMLLSNLVFWGFGLFIALVVHFVTGWGVHEAYNMVIQGGEEIKIIYHQIPNLLQMPGLFAALVLYLIWSFLMYGFHYLGHVSRIYWLLAHRPHHATTALTNGTGFLADMEFALHWMVAIVQSAILVAVSKLITQDQETVAVTFFCFAIFYQFMEVFNHAATFYQTVKNNRLLNLVTKLFSCGPYHILHHSAHVDHQMVNLGGNSGIWDFVFGTYCPLPEEEPNFGLTDQPALRLSATAITLGGLQQILYELWHNRGFRTRWKILFGGIYYKPPITKDFLVDLEGGLHHIMHRVKL